MVVNFFEAMAKITFRKVNYHAHVNNTWLQTYADTIIKMVEYKNGRIDIHTKNGWMQHCEGNYVSEYNGFSYTLKKILGRPLRMVKI